MKDKCKWVVRFGTDNTLWAHTPCKPGFNYLSKTNKVEELEDLYDNRQCPICGNTIELNLKLVLDDAIYV